jgi:hypothetical protein
MLLGEVLQQHQAEMATQSRDAVLSTKQLSQLSSDDFKIL